MSSIKRCRDDVYIAFRELFAEWQSLEASSAGDPNISEVGERFVVPACRRSADLINALEALDRSLEALVQYGVEVR